MTRQFGVFYEPHQTTSMRGTDLLGFARSRAWCLACEFKTYKTKESPMVESRMDLQRLIDFRLNQELKEERCGTSPVEVLSKCTCGVGFVGGIHYRYQNSHKVPRVPDNFSSLIRTMHGFVGQPCLVREYSDPVIPPGIRGAYYLYYACIPITPI